MHDKRKRIEDSDDSSSSSDECATSDNDAPNLDDMTVAQLKEAVRKSQLEKNVAEKKMRKALGDVTNYDVEGDHPTSKKSKGKPPKKRRQIVRVPSDEGSGRGDDDSGGDSDSADEKERGDEEKRVASLGRRFVLVKTLWIKDGTLDANLDDSYDEKKRFDGAEVQGQFRDLIKMLPAQYKGKVKREAWFQRAFLKGMSDRRSNTSSRIRRVAGASIYDCLAGSLLKHQRLAL
ncbi:hypothetical protein DFH08DRAFT_972156 [Mycena albidolilacea]|uniref:Uncharacterized protein n=1 Tax=Mycena albidolilacea TaxID=1033008 RepID=A0AAD7EER3_9AGAR|nr:hypothetical protein DFH08DRAFT_972156 [Mycena albidolilacea]